MAFQKKKKLHINIKNEILPIDIDDSTLKRLYSSDGFNKIYLKAYLTLRSKFVYLPVLSINLAVTLFILQGS